MPWGRLFRRPRDKGRQMTDRELLELAAKAAGLNIKSYTVDNDGKLTHLIVGRKFTKERVAWNPRTNDGDSRRLQMQLKISLECTTHYAAASYQGFVVQKMYGSDQAATARSAVLQVAAEIGRNKQ